MAASDRFRIDIKGKGGHGAGPHQTVDAIVEAAALVTSLQTVVSRSNVRINHYELLCIYFLIFPLFGFIFSNNVIIAAFNSILWVCS